MTINYGALAAPQPARSAYTLQVAQIAPFELSDRDAELAELAGFCVEEKRGPYVWWRAGPWAGKTALLSTFVSRPPELLAANSVVLVSFFITARLASQDTREAFTATLIEQLCAVLGRALPIAGAAGSQEAAVLELLKAAAEACEHAGGRLVLVVDGLDEDRGVTTGPGARSIAALLPKKPWAGMRVIVAGRPNPPIPDDVPGDHPLRQPGIVRKLDGSLHAYGLKDLGKSELKRLLKGTRTEKDLLGLLTAASGGLSGPDLRELTGTDLVELEEILHTVTGRTFTRRLARWAPDGGPQVYLLGHEELHNTACLYIGNDALAAYRDRLHSWAESYRAPGDGRPPWPPNTPEYLLTGYPRMLAATHDNARLTALATDRARHDRMLDLTCGDAAALSEVTACQGLHLNGAQPDLCALARLARHRDQLEFRNSLIPTQLPAVWAVLGQPDRAEELALAISTPLFQAGALTELARVMAAAGDARRARELTAYAERTLRSITNPNRRASELCDLAQVLAATGDHARARRLADLAESDARRITDPEEQAWALIELIEARTAAGDHEDALRLAAQVEQGAGDIADPEQRSWVLAQLAGAVAKVDDREHTRHLAAAEQIARSIAEPYKQVWTLVKLIEEAAASGDLEHASRLAAHAEHAARAVTDTEMRVEVLAKVVGATVAAGNHEHAQRLATEVERSARDTTDAPLLAVVAEALAAAGKHERAEQIALGITDSYARTRTLVAVTEALAARGSYERAGQIAREITYPHTRAQVLTAAAKIAAAAGDDESARRLAALSEQAARNIVDLFHQAQALAAVANATVEAGNSEYARHLTTLAEQTAQAEGDTFRQVLALTAVAELLAAGCHRGRSSQLLNRAEQVARTVTEQDDRARALAEVASAMAETGNYELAEQIAHMISLPQEQVRALSAACEAAVAAGGDQERARLLATRAEQEAGAITDPEDHARALGQLAEAWIKIGDPEHAQRLTVRAEQVAETVTPLFSRGRALSNLVEVVAAAGRWEDAERIARCIPEGDWTARAWAALAEAMAASGDYDRADQIARRITDVSAQSRALAAVAEAVATAGERERAERITRMITEPQWRAEALTTLAKAAGPPEARRLLGEAFTLGSWPTPLSAMAQLYPAEVLRFIEAEYPDVCRGSASV